MGSGAKLLFQPCPTILSGCLLYSAMLKDSNSIIHPFFCFAMRVSIAFKNTASYC